MKKLLMISAALALLTTSAFAEQKTNMVITQSLDPLDLIDLWEPTTEAIETETQLAARYGRSSARSSSRSRSSSSSSRSRSNKATTTKSRPTAKQKATARANSPARSTKGQPNGRPTPTQMRRDQGGMLPFVPTLGLGTAGQLMVIALIMGAYNSFEDSKAEAETEAKNKALRDAQIAKQKEKEARIAKRKAQDLAYLQGKCKTVEDSWGSGFWSWWYTCDSITASK